LRARAVLIDLRDLCPGMLLRAVAEASDGVLDVGLRAVLESEPRLRTIPTELIEAFLRCPCEVRSTKGVCGALRMSREKAQELLREAGFNRGEHLWTLCRATAYRWFAAQSLVRSQFEQHLGIRERRSFRRACQRASVEVPWQRGPRTATTGPCQAPG